MSNKTTLKHLKNILSTFSNVTENPEEFLSVDEGKSKSIKNQILKNLYDFMKKNEGEKSSALSELIVDQMDEEQIWQQLEIQNEEAVQKNIKCASQWLSVKDALLEAFDNPEESSAESGEENPDQQSFDEDQQNFPESQNLDRKKKSYKKSIVDDKFFKLREMEEFLDQEDRREMKSGKDESDDESSEEIDFFEDVESSSDEENDDKNLKYSDFFDPEDGEVERNFESEGEGDPENDELEAQSNNSDSDEFDIGKLGDAPESEEENPQENVQQDSQPYYQQNERQDPSFPSNEPKSTFELRQEKLKQKITSMEYQMLDDRPWQLKGEIQGDTRPQNSLLEEILEFDTTTRPAPVITEETTLKLEDIIRQRIKDKAFDDVERKVKPTDIQFEYKKQLVLDQEKSKQSLAQIYEKEYIKEVEKANPNATEEEEEEPKEHKEIRAKMKDLFDKLDTLSNFFYTPKPAAPELKIITNLPTITMEEVAPVAESDARLLAPEEIKRKPKGDIMGKAERTKTDKNRERRKKKQFQKQKKIREEGKSITNPKLQSKLSRDKMVDKVTKGRNVEKMKEISADKTSKSSKEFFSKLQDEVSNVTDKIRKDRTKNKRKADSNGISAKKIKL